MLTPRTTAFLKSSVGFLKPRNAVSYIPSRSLMTLKDVKVCFSLGTKVNDIHRSFLSAYIDINCIGSRLEWGRRVQRSEA